MRDAHAQVKREVSAGELTIAEALADPRALDGRLAVYLLLRAVPGFGRMKVRRMLEWLQIRENKAVAELTDRQRGLIVGALDGDLTPVNTPDTLRA